MMVTDPASTLIKSADELLIAAEQEQQRAIEDVVTHLICSNSRKSIYNFLYGYLLNKNIPIQQPVSIASMHKQCQSIDPRFDWLDLEKVNCRYETHDRYYCLEYDNVEKCLKAAQHVRSIVMAETPGY